MKLNSFDGGLSTRLDASLIQPNEGTMYDNIDNSSTILKSISGALQLDTEVRGYFHKFKGEWLSSNAYRTYLEYQNKLYYTEVGQRPKKYNGFLNVDLGIIPPETKLTTVQANPTATEKVSVSASTLQYTYTYYNIDYGIESVPAPISDELSLDANKVVDITDIQLSGDVQVSHVRIYRIGDGITTMTLVEEIRVVDIIEPIRDDTLTVNLPGSLLDSYSNYPPPEDLSNIIEAYGIVFGTSGTKLYYSVIGKPDYFPKENFIDFANDLKGLIKVTDGILVQSLNTTDILIGNSGANFSVLTVSDEQGCVDHLTNNKVSSVPVWVSTDGVVKYENGFIQVISRDKLGKIVLDVVNTVVHDEVYYILKTDGTILAMDARFKLIFKTINDTSTIQNIARADDTLYVSIDEKLCTMFEGDDLDLTYLSPLLTDGDHANTKLYNNIYVRSDGDFIFKIFIDGKEVLNKLLNGDKIHDVKPPQEKQRGSNIQYSIQGKGKIYEIEYKVQGRQNGR